MKSMPLSDRTAVQVPRISVLLFVFGALCLDLNLPRLGSLKIGNLVMVASMLLSIGLLAYKNAWRLPFPSIRSSNRILLVYLGLIAASTLWAPSAMDTLYQCVLLIVIYAASVFLASAPIERVVRSIVVFACIAAVLSLAVIPADRALAFQPFTSGERPELRGVFEHQLRLGLYMGLALGLVVLAALNGDLRRIFPQRWWLYLCLPLIFAAFVLAYARLYSFFVVVALALTIAFALGRWMRWIAGICTLAVVVVAITIQSSLESTLAGAGVDTSLTGRTTIWLRSIGEAALTPLKGHGFASFDQPAFDHLWPGVYRPPHPHNSFIQAFFENGYLGFGLVVLLALSHIWVAGARNPDQRYSYTFFFVLTMVLGSLTGANYASKPVTLYCLVLLMTSIAIQTRNKSK
ncbi:O-antigen ligase family protein [Stenotrophomonas pennii]|uniref:O-antigen ligase family protein n=1 Tax=Stenotrophomonas lacuserhaii TaxID=2760084 RepID=UPI0032095748